MKNYKKNMGHKTIAGIKKIMGVFKARKTLLYTQLLNLYIKYGLEVTGCYVMLCIPYFDLACNSPI